jgi:hypothetical protein
VLGATEAAEHRAKVVSELVAAEHPVEEVLLRRLLRWIGRWAEKQEESVKN